MTKNYRNHQFDMGGLYKIHCDGNNKDYYGQTNEIWRRLGEHIRALKNNRHYCKKLQRTFNKYGIESFSWEVHALCEDPEERDLLEITIINAIGLKNLLNESVGGKVRRGWKHTAETKEKIRILAKSRDQSHLHKPEYIEARVKTRKEKNNYEHLRTPEARERSKQVVKIAHAAAIIFNSIPVNRVDLITGEIKTYSSAAEGAKDSNCHRASITSVCKEKSKRAGGFGWEYA